MKAAPRTAKRAVSTTPKTHKNVVSLRSENLTKIAAPRLEQRSPEIQKYGIRVGLPIGLDDKICTASIEALNQVLADTITIRDLYKKHHWQVAGLTFYQLHLLYDKHYNEQNELVDMIAERIQVLGGISLAMAADVAEETNIECPPRGREQVPVQISRLAEAHEIILREARKAAEAADDGGDSGTNDLLISNIVRTNELQVWFLTEHMAPETLLGDRFTKNAK